MKRLLWVGLIVSSVFTTWSAEKITSLTVGEREMKEIRDVHLGTDGRVIILCSGGGVALTQDKLPDDFLESWGIKRNEAKEMHSKKSEEELDKAVAAGMFREIDGIIYDTRKPPVDWVNFYNVRVLQILDEGAILITGGSVAIFVRHLPEGLGDTDHVSFLAKPAGNYSYINKINDDRTIRAYDLGRPCKRSELPQPLVDGTQTLARKLVTGRLTNNVVAKLPYSDQLTASGSGFFITEDGYLVTNNHVVEDATAIKIKNSSGVYPAEIVKTDKTADLALLKVSGRFHPMRLSEKDEAQLGQTAFTIGFPNIVMQGVEPKYTDGKISSISGLHDDPTEYQISVPIQPGNSGGPLVGSDGAVIGVIVARLNAVAVLRSSGNLPENVNYAIKGKVLREFLKTAPISIPPLNPAKPEDAIRNTEQSVVMVLVY